jgi:hypothetical protein
MQNIGLEFVVMGFEDAGNVVRNIGHFADVGPFVVVESFKAIR